MNRVTSTRHKGDDALAGPIRGYELAAQMQSAVPQVADLEGETAATQALYGLDRPETTDFGRACLIGAAAARARRAVRAAFLRRHVRHPRITGTATKT